MAERKRHAAGQEPRFEVRESRAGESTGELGMRFVGPDYLEALDFAFDFLTQNDPLRTGDVAGLEIVKVIGENRETVWTYSHDQARSQDVDPVGLWGFDVRRAWRRPATGFRQGRSLRYRRT